MSLFNTAYRLIFVLLLISNSFVFSQVKKDTIYLIDKNITTKGKFYAKDSIFNDLKTKQTHLFGDALLEYDGIKITASYILFDIDKKEVFASYKTNESGKRIGEPIVFQDGEEIHA